MFAHCKRTAMAPNVVPIALFVAFLWGIQPIIHKHVLKRIDPRVVMAIGSVFYFACMLLFFLYNRAEIKQGAHSVTKADVAWIGLASILTAFVANLIYFYILRDHESYIISALIYASPVFTLAVAYFVLKERVSWIGGLGVAFVMLGIALLAFNEKNHHSEEFLDMR